MTKAIFYSIVKNDFSKFKKEWNKNPDIKQLNKFNRNIPYILFKYKRPYKWHKYINNILSEETVYNYCVNNNYTLDQIYAEFKEFTKRSKKAALKLLKRYNFYKIVNVKASYIIGAGYPKYLYPGHRNIEIGEEIAFASIVVTENELDHFLSQLSLNKLGKFYYNNNKFKIKFPLDSENNIDFGKNKIGCEFEYCCPLFDVDDKLIMDYHQDGSVDNGGYEGRSFPLPLKAWNLKDINNFIEKIKAQNGYVNSSAGLHIHVSHDNIKHFYKVIASQDNWEKLNWHRMLSTISWRQKNRGFGINQFRPEQLKDFGTFEFRHFEATMDPLVIFKRIRICWAIVKLICEKGEDDLSLLSPRIKKYIMELAIDQRNPCVLFTNNCNIGFTIEELKDKLYQKKKK